MPHPKDHPILRKVRSESLTYLGLNALRDLFVCVRSVEEGKTEGILIEAGCALGGSSIVLATAKNHSRELFVYDVFSMIPPPSERDGEDVHTRYVTIKKGKSDGIGGNLYYGYEEDLYAKVQANFERFDLSPDDNNIRLIKGFYEDTLFLEDPVALAHLDCDWYDSVMVCLNRIVPHLVQGGVIVVDDYYHWSGCKEAVDDYFSDKMDDFLFTKKSRLHITRR